MAKVRALSLAAALGLAIVTVASPAAPYVVEALTSIGVADAWSNATLDAAIQAAVSDITAHAVAFTPTRVSLREVKVIGDRIYLLILLTDTTGEAELEALGGQPSATPGPR